MKLAEALINRADARKRILQIRERLQRNVVIQEGTQPAENPQALLEELDRTLDEFTRLVRQINMTNSATRLNDQMTLTDALALRDRFILEGNILRETINTASLPQQRYSRSEILSVVTVNVAELQTRLDDLSRQHRQLDTAIQQTNWQTDLMEDPGMSEN